MRRWLTVFLLILLPLQLSWAVAATYCQHEADPAASHIGHHQHEHHGLKASDDTSATDATGKVAKAKNGAQPAPAGVDNDCGSCHLGHAQPVFSAPPRLPALVGPVARTAPSGDWSSRGPDRRERPNWRLA
ncbi:hypothetical protein CDN99_07835 [Roseateles aquatilis]|uniref:Cobalt-zinc-cadmium resistance protein n=1 Tax=Roseateles aquatilis TaxID=431061 RepID=A0A246JI88_9BURK|nr:cation efflux protein, CzcI family [Roseateles aquatilis]OWQ92240.1 hypothetical protein CDN99_07835 [Roseateles aquatilis]